MTEGSLSIPPAIYIWDGSGLVVMRVQLLSGDGGETLMIRLVSANPGNLPHSYPAEEVHVFGRVVWVVQRM